jgi:serine/threonine protein phosphatase PrpC
MNQPVLAPFVDGQAAVFTAKSPDKPTSNEDAAALIPFDDSSGVLVVADGVGGTRAGEAASRCTVEALRAALRNGARDDQALRTAVLNGIENANRAVLELGVGAATTLALVELQASALRPYHIGDSMILAVGQRGRVKLRTVSHSPVGFAVEAGLLDEKEALHHEERHLVSNVIGTPEMRIEVGASLSLMSRDTVLLGSDGLFDNVHLEEIVELIRKGPLDRAALRLAELATHRMHDAQEGQPSKPDDLTFVLFRKTLRRPRRGSGSAPTPASSESPGP